jgi:predicted RNA-binding Zn ribbon-like protein
MDSFEAAWPGVGIGGSLALDFANTKDWRLRREPVEQLNRLDDLLRWGRTAGILEPGEAQALRDWGDAHPRAARRALAKAIEVREAIAAVFQAVARGQAVPSGPLARLDAVCGEAFSARSLRHAGEAVAWEWRELSSNRAAQAAALDAARILTSSQRQQVRECGDAECGWLFVDTSRNRLRRWCTMPGCGNRNKARRFQSRQRNP